MIRIVQKYTEYVLPTHTTQSVCVLIMFAAITALTHSVYSSRKSPDDQWTLVTELLDSIIVCNDVQCNPNSENMSNIPTKR